MRMSMGGQKTRPTRRAVLQGFGGALGAAALGCGGPPGQVPDGGDDTGGESDAAAAADAGVDRCAVAGGLSAEELLAGIDTIVVLCMENRSFDHYLGSLA